MATFLCSFSKAIFDRKLPLRPFSFPSTIRRDSILNGFPISFKHHFRAKQPTADLIPFLSWFITNREIDFFDQFLWRSGKVPNRTETALLGTWRAHLEGFLHEMTSRKEVNVLEGYFDSWNENEAEKSRKIDFNNFTLLAIIFGLIISDFCEVSSNIKLKNIEISMRSFNGRKISFWIYYWTHKIWANLGLNHVK